MLEPALEPVLRAYGFTPAAQLTQLEGGLINRTYRVEQDGKKNVLQRLHPIFAPSVNLDIAAITQHLASKGVLTPRVVPTLEGALWTIDHENFTWRMLNWLDGRIVSVVERPELAHSAAQLVARFHEAVRDLTHRFHFTRPGAHDTPLHMSRLETGLAQARDNPRYETFAPVAEAILREARTLPALPSGPTRLIHGDLKISNVMFEGDRAIALLDLDTMAELTIPIEIGDALRSWCNPAGEDATRVVFRADVFEAAMRGYLPIAAPWLTREERDALVVGAQTIALELSSRFCIDILSDSYWGWNASKFASRSEHNLARASSQLCLAQSIAEQRAQLEAVVRAF